ncbi:hypothetical protein MICAI_2130004 [Microcystis sp. T1-4]|nr:hypothetical protein MICAI_2130004 [Microcystis sp. T1-4]
MTSFANVMAKFLLKNVFWCEKPDTIIHNPPPTTVLKATI